MARYVVEIKSFKTDEWYTKTETDSIAAATSVALIYSKGCGYRIIDTDTDTIIREGY